MVAASSQHRTPFSIVDALLRVTAVLVATVMGALPLIVTTAAPAAAAGLTSTRKCADFVSGDGYRRLSICARGYVDGSYVRGVVEMHTYARHPGYNGWYDSRSQSITLNNADLYANTGTTRFGNDVGAQCRVNSASGPVACSVPNATRVAFYSAQRLRDINQPATTWVWKVSWRDDRGIPYFVYQGSGSTPDQLPISYSWR